MAEKRIELVLAKHIGTNCERLYKTENWSVDDGDLVKVESPSMGERYAVAIATRDYVDEEELAFWCKVFDITDIKRVLSVATMKEIKYEEKKSDEVKTDETV